MFLASALFALSAALPQPLEQALTIQVDETELSTGHFRVTEGPARIEFRVTYDDQRQAELTLLAPAETAMTKAEVELWEAWQGDDEADGEEEDSSFDGAYNVENLRASIGGEVSELGREDGLLVYAFTPLSLFSAEDGESQSIVEHLTGRVAVDERAGHIAWVEYSAPESFKPNIAARVEDFTMRVSFLRETPDAQPRMGELAFEIAGSAAFQPFSQNSRIELISAEFTPAD
jgi:hypothetical protein